MAAHAALAEGERQLVARLKEVAARYAPLRVLLYGSRARGDALRDSDFDLIVVSPVFRGVPFLQRSIELGMWLSAVSGVDLLCYTPEEFARKQHELGIVGIAVRTGRDLL